MGIRLHETEDECRRTAEALATVLDVLDTSRPYPDRSPSRLFRLYLTATVPNDHPEEIRQ